MFHARHEVDTSDVTGDLTGTLTLDDSVDIDLETGRGVVYGSFVLATDEVTWTGTFRGEITATGASGSFVGQGSDGSKLLGTFTSIGPGVNLDEGVILNPHG